MTALTAPWIWVCVAYVVVPGLIGAWLSLRLALPLVVRGWCAWRRRSSRPLFGGVLATAPLDTPVTIEGRLVRHHDGVWRLALDARDDRVDLDGPVVAWIGGETLTGDDWPLRVRDGDRAIARGRLRVTDDDHHGADAYRGASRGRALAPDGTHVRLTVLAARGAPRWRLVALAVGTLAGFIALDGAAQRLEAPLFAELSTPTGWRVRSTRYPRVVLEPTYHQDFELECTILSLLPRTHARARERCAPWTIEIAPDTYGAEREALRWIDDHEDVRTRVRVWMTLGQVSTALTIARQSRDPSLLAQAARWAFAVGDITSTRKLLDRLARRAPLGDLQGAWACAHVFDANLYDIPRVDAGDDDVSGQLPESARAVMRCLLDARAGSSRRERYEHAFRDDPLPSERVRSMVESPHTVCRILGVTWLSQRDDHALAALAEAARTSEPEWLPWIDATRNVIWFEGIVSGRAHAPPPRQADAFGDLDAAQLERMPGLAHLLELTSYGPQRAGYHWLVERVQLPALDALAEVHARTHGSVVIRGFGLEPPFPDGVVSWYTHPADDTWLRWAKDGYRMALASFEDARARDPRFDDRWRVSARSDHDASWRPLSSAPECS